MNVGAFLFFSLNVRFCNFLSFKFGKGGYIIFI